MKESICLPAEEIRWKEAENRRTTLYTAIKELLSPEAKIFYPAAGADRLPAIVFKGAIVYGVFHMSFLDDLQRPVSLYPRYSFQPAIQVPHWIPYDFTKSQLGEQFDLVLLRGVGEIHSNPKYAGVYDEMQQLLKSNGLLIIEDEDCLPQKPDMETLRAGFEKFKEIGFQEHVLDGKYGDVISLSIEQVRKEFEARFKHHPGKAEALMHTYYPPPYNPYQEREGFHITRVLQKNK